MADQTTSWSPGVHAVLENIRKNCVTYAAIHRKRYLKYKQYAKYFKIPIILLSSVNSVASVGLQGYMAQGGISMMTCIVSLACAVITSIELYLGVQRTMESELLASKEYYLLGIDIFKILQLDPKERLVNARAYLDDKYKWYCKLVEQSEPIKHTKDVLAPNQHIITREAHGVQIQELFAPPSPSVVARSLSALQLTSVDSHTVGGDESSNGSNVSSL